MRAASFVYNIKNRPRFRFFARGSSSNGGAGLVSGRVYLQARAGVFPDGREERVALGPGFDFDDFEIGGQAALLEDFPGSRELIKKLA